MRRGERKRERERKVKHHEGLMDALVGRPQCPQIHEHTFLAYQRGYQYGARIVEFIRSDREVPTRTPPPMF